MCLILNQSKFFVLLVKFYLKIAKRRGTVLKMIDRKTNIFRLQKIDASAIEDFYGLPSDTSKSSETGYILFYQSRESLWGMFLSDRPKKSRKWSNVPRARRETKVSARSQRVHSKIVINWAVFGSDAYCIIKKCEIMFYVQKNSFWRSFSHRLVTVFTCAFFGRNVW